VPLRTDSYYRSLAEAALKEAGVSEPPVPIEDIARGYGIPVRDVSLPSFFGGAIVNEDGLPVILVNTAKEEHARRKILAHLVGHVVVVLGDPEGAYTRDAVEVHVDADNVADELLTPAYLVIDQAQKWFNDYRYLARLFGVTEDEMMQKMLNMGIIKQRGIHWDY
jgi:Zn-dependent peptidase ImmA (M78 family)